MVKFWDDCLSSYQCGKINKTVDVDLKKPGENGAAVYTPFVEITFRGNNKFLTVGNHSSPSFNHKAMITSWQYGTSTGTGGCGMKVEITDEGGYLYNQVVQGLNKDITKALSSVNTGVKGCECRFGWIVKDCSGTVSIIDNTTSTPCEEGGGRISFLPLNVETNFEGGVIKFVLEATDLFVRSLDARLQEPFGDDANKMDLKTALRTLFKERDPKFSDVKFFKKDGTPGLEFKSDNIKDGYKATLQAEQETNVSCARKWLNDTRSKEDRGILIIYDPCNNEVIIHEDPSDENCCNKNIGTYIVNGGNESPVLSFNPSIKWPIGVNAGSGGTPSGSATGASGTDTNKADEQRPIPFKAQNTGVQTSPNIQGNQNLYRNPEDQPIKTRDNMTVHNRASKVYEQVDAVSAELKIMGDPRYVQPVFLTGKWVSLVVIDPYYLDEGGDGCEWISNPTCNAILSNKKWMIMGLDHQITSGSFVTTFKLQLLTPNVNWPGGDTFSGCGTEPLLESEPTPPAK